jgi:NitT/TauT family transport system substrate-binding protein
VNITGKLLFFGLLVYFIGCTKHFDERQVAIRIGYFSNITHSQALLGFSAARGDFQKNFDDSVRIDTKIFNAGPSAIEALFAGELDLTYIGPNPAINGFVKSRGEALRIIAGATSGGAGQDKRHYREILNNEEKKIIEKIFEKEIQLFGYKF